MNNDNNKNNKMFMLVIGMLLLVVITLGVTYAIFSYTKLGTTDNTIRTGSLKFLYTENSAGGTGINITNALPMSDTNGMALIGDNNVFDFKVEGTNVGNDIIPYEVTLRKKKDSTMDENDIKIYLQDTNDNSDLLVPTLYSNLKQTNVDVDDNIEKTLYTGAVKSGEVAYLKSFRLRMWVDSNSTQEEVNGKTFKATVNVYANAKLASDTIGN